MARVLIVGGAGYVGGWLTDQSILAGHEVRVLDNLTYEDMYLKAVDFFYADILDFKSIEKHLEWAETVIWLSALVGDPACALNPKLTLQTNVSSIKNLVSAFGGRIIFPSTCSVYGAQNEILTEQSPVAPLSLYAETKLEAENILLSSGAKVLIFRLGTLFGLGDTYSRLRVDLVLNALTIRAVYEKSMSVFGGEQFRPLLHVRDVATAAIPEIESNSSGIYNLHNENLSILELAKCIKKQVPDSELEVTEISFQDARNYRVDSSKAKSELSFIPKFSVEFGINEVRDAVLRKRIKNFSNPRFNNSETLRISLNQKEKI